MSTKKTTRKMTITKGASSQPGVPRRTNAAATGRASKPTKSPLQSPSHTDWRKLNRKTAAQIRHGISADPDAHPTDNNFWKTAKVVLPVPKEIVTMRLDADLLRWFRQNRGYQTRINAILRAYMQAQS